MISGDLRFNMFDIRIGLKLFSKHKNIQETTH